MKMFIDNILIFDDKFVSNNDKDIITAKLE